MCSSGYLKSTAQAKLSVKSESGAWLEIVPIELFWWAFLFARIVKIGDRGSTAEKASIGEALRQGIAERGRGSVKPPSNPPIDPRPGDQL